MTKTKQDRKMDNPEYLQQLYDDGCQLERIGKNLNQDMMAWEGVYCPTFDTDQYYYRISNTI